MDMAIEQGQYTVSVHEILLWDMGNNFGIALFLLANLIADGFLIWRCFVLWNRRLSIVIIPIMSLVSGTVFGFAMLAFSIKMYMFRLHVPHNTVEPPPEWMQLNASFNATNIGQFSSSCITNVSISGMIAFRIWKLTRDVVKKKSQYLRVAWLVLETGFLYSVCLVLAAAFGGLQAPVNKSGPIVSADVVDAVSLQLVGIFPTVIILLVALGKSSDQTIEYSGTANRNRERRSQVSSIHFAIPARAHASNETGGTHTIELQTRSIADVVNSPDQLDEVEEV
ncbi:hypothetical protein NEOLEDRAFT_1179439 [Neolentinus lepideus HHB14362 ss-1]|uniref:Uncharacterized protein n=1 Tax=Neolentinus lepideus HHB14362 ss-1 TaxID=1314782 RepID=A0A165RRQ6_9AGAM|nr:hypothetical protein NEOLEDRAFT_1179439 [Neolentinus lepideus HHB14362 ss-1]